LLVGIVLAFGAGGGQGIPIGSGAGSGSGSSGSSVPNPCDPGGSPIRFGKYRLPCGDPGYGYTHIDRKHGPLSHDTLECIGKVLALSKGKPEGRNMVFQYAFRSGDWARVVVRRETGNIVSAYTRGDGPASARWKACVKA
jgi:hypothetical protein